MHYTQCMGGTHLRVLDEMATMPSGQCSDEKQLAYSSKS